MAFPFLLALAAIQGFSAYKQSEETREAAEFQNKLDAINEKYAEYDAYQAEVFGATEAARYDVQIKGTLGAQKVAFAGQDIDVGYGTAKELQQETELIGTLNLIDIQNEARMRSIGLKREVGAIRTGMNLRKSQAEINANAQLTSGMINAGSTAFRGYTQTFGEEPNVLGGSNKTSKRY